MRGETAVENGVEGVEHGGNSAPTETTNGEKRPSVAMLKNMLENSPRNLFQHDYNNGVQKHLHSSSQNGASGDSTRSNPFYLYHLESVNKSHLMEANEWKSSGVANGGIFIPPPDYESSPFERTVEDEDKFSEPLSPSQTNKHEEKLFRTNIMDQSATAIGFRDTTLKSPKTISRNAAPTQNSSKTWHRNGYNLKDGADDYLNTAKREELIHTEYPQEVVMLEKSPNVFVDPFKSPSNEIQSPQTVATNLFYHTKAAEPDLFQAGSTKHDKLSYGQENKEDTSYEERDIFGDPFNKTLDIFSSSSVTSVDPFPSPLSRNLFNTSSLDDPFGPTPSKQQDPFQDVSNGTPDIFQPQFKEAKKSKDIFEITSSTSLNNSPTNVKLSTPASTDLPKKTPRPPPPYRPKRSNTLKDLELTTPQESKQDPLQSTPFSQSISPSASPSPSPTDMTHVSTFKRPPKPLPRTRHHRPEMPPKPERPPLPEIFVSPITQLEPESDELKPPPKPLFKLPPKPPKPVIRLKPKTPDIKPVNPENYVVFEDVLLTGQERCVEDWPEDSPEINPDFKPPGKFKLRRESMKVKIDSDGGSIEELDGSGDHTKKKTRKMRRPLLSMRRLKDKFPDDTMDARSNTLPIMQKSSKDEENEDDYYSSMDLKKKSHTKAKVNNLFRRASSGSFGFDGKHKNRKNSDTDKTDTIGRRHSEQATLYDSYTEEEEKKKSKVKVKFVPQRGFAITRGKLEDEPKGGYGLTPRKGSKDKSLEELGAYGFTPRDKSKDFEDEEEMEDLNLELAAKGAYMDDEHLKKPRSYSPIPNGDVDGIQDRKHHKKSKIKIRSVSRRSSKENMLDDSSMQKKKSSLSAEELDDEEFYGMEDCKLKNSKQKAPAPAPRKPRRANKLREGGSAEDIGDMKSPEEMYDEEQDDLDLCKPKKQFKLKVPKKFKHKSKAMPSEGEGPAGGHLSEAAKAEWMAAQKDGGGMEGLEEEDDEEDGDTDSLMEWWYTVEQWDELPSDEEDAALKEDESKSFTILAYKVERGLRVFNKVFTEQAEALWEYLITLHALADDISEFHHKAKIAGITGGTTTAVGSVAAITGLALAPLTFGASLVITAVGVGVATAGGITSASAAISDNVNNMQDRKKIETVLKDYEDRMLDIAKVLHFINQGLVKLRGHPFLRSGTQHYSQDWEVRNAVQIISLVDSPVMKATEITDDAVASLQGLFKGMDKFFTKDTRELKKGCKKEIVGEIRHVANVLNDCIMDLNEIREDLQKATGS